MREIYFLRDGESKKNINIMNDKNLVVPNDKLFGSRYVISNMGKDDITFVRNYFPLYEYTLKTDERVIDIMARGYSAIDNGEMCGESIILERPSANRYIVKPLDTIQSIAYRYNTSVDDIIDINHLKTQKLFVGQILWL